MGVAFHMRTFGAAGAAFLLAVLWLDLMFDVQSRKHTTDPLPTEVLSSISAYYRRITTEAYPMNRLVELVMLFTLAAIVAEIVEGVRPWWIGWVSLALAGGSVVPTVRRTFPNAQRLGGADLDADGGSVRPGVQGGAGRAESLGQDARRAAVQQAVRLDVAFHRQCGW